MKDPREVIIRPIITEHSYDMMSRNVYTFEVAKDANKIEIFATITPVFDAERFGIKNTPSPRHADILVFTGADQMESNGIIEWN